MLGIRISFQRLVYAFNVLVLLYIIAVVHYLFSNKVWTPKQNVILLWTSYYGESWKIENDLEISLPMGSQYFSNCEFKVMKFPNQKSEFMPPIWNVVQQCKLNSFYMPVKKRDVL